MNAVPSVRAGEVRARPRDVACRPAATDRRLALSRWLTRLSAMAERRRQRRRLRALAENPDFLHDIGISRADALREASRPFWRN